MKLPAAYLTHGEFLQWIFKVKWEKFKQKKFINGDKFSYLIVFG